MLGKTINASVKHDCFFLRPCSGGVTQSWAAHHVTPPKPGTKRGCRTRSPRALTEGNSSCVSFLCTPFRSYRKQIPGQLPPLAWRRETASKSCGIGQWFQFKETGLSPSLLSHPSQSPPTPTLSCIVHLCSYTPLSCRCRQTLPLPSVFPTTAPPPGLLLESLPVSINNS